MFGTCTASRSASAPDGRPAVRCAWTTSSSGSGLMTLESLSAATPKNSGEHSMWTLFTVASVHQQGLPVA